MNGRAIGRTHASALTLVTVSFLVLLIVVGCNLDLGVHCPIGGHGAPGPEPEELTAIAAVLNKTAGPLTVTLTDPPATDVLEPDEAIFYEVSQSMEARTFQFQSGESVGTGSLLLLTGGENPGFATGLLMVSSGDNAGTLAVDQYTDLHSPFAIARGAVAPGSSVFLIVNGASFRFAVTAPGGGVVMGPDEHTAIVVDEGATLAVALIADLSEAPELVHVLEAPASEDGQVSAFIVFVTLHGNELAVESQSAGFRRLE